MTRRRATRAEGDEGRAGSRAPGIARLALVPAALLFRVAVAARGALYEAGALRPRRVAVPVISVGNLTVGGTGKTPLVIWIAQRLLEIGVQPGILLRGYGARRGRAPRLVSGAAPAALARESDEAILLAARLPGVPVVAGRDRVRGAALAIAAGARALVLDDGFQHRALARDLDLLLLDPRFPPPRSALLPAGPFREPWPAARRAHLLLAVDAPAMPSPNGRPILRAERRASALRLAGARLAPDALAGRRVALLSGIARPDAFRSLIARLGATVVTEARFPDHHRFRNGEPERALAEARAAAADLVVTTEKDAARLPRSLLDRADVGVLEIAIHFPEGDAPLLSAIRETVGARAR